MKIFGYIILAVCVLVNVNGQPGNPTPADPKDIAVTQLTEFLKGRAQSVYDDFFNKNLQTPETNPELRGRTWWPTLPSFPPAIPPLGGIIPKPPVLVPKPIPGAIPPPVKPGVPVIVPPPPPPSPPLNVEPCTCNIFGLSCSCCLSVKYPLFYINSRSCGVVYFNPWILSTVVDVYLDANIIYHTVIPVAAGK